MKRPKKLLDIESAPAFAKALRREIRERLALKKARDPEYPDQWKRRLYRKPAGMGPAEYARLILWHRQFSGPGVPGLAMLVGFAHAITAKARRLRSPS